ncbi:serine hydrolase domain-containing protein [Maribacter sp. 4G9]|uniref:serine hydrolase domain-containing protein n=1 Tax=Maribacter sp. 4G9 TaxID=1889777 RepID=UPI000C14BB5A|nr:serine hydrolase domain-containing protein [Maribacter sp. 4G9]PIB23592.1 hypothetical protein BFP75_10035 [Maribacter sp. 4G9]
MKKILLFAFFFLIIFSCDQESIDATNESLAPEVNLPSTPVEEQTEEPKEQPSTQVNLNGITADFERFMSQYNFRGAQMAIIRNEKLVYLNAFGVSDVEKNSPVSNSTLFRIASISKPITLLAISKLVLDGKLSLDERVFGANSILGNTYGNLPFENNELQITVDHLVEHTAGFANEPTDIMFEQVDSNFNVLADRVLDERSLTFEPGLRFQYSNFGYALLGKIIEAKSGQSYKDYVKGNILEPNLIHEVYMGKNTVEDKLPDETIYYSSWASPYSMNIERLDAAGGWVSNAKSLALLAVKSDGRFSVNNILPAGNGVSYLSRSSWTHNGALPGTLAVLRVGHPFSYVVLVNGGEANFATVLDAIHTFMNNMIERQDAWPNTDLFEPSR